MLLNAWPPIMATTNLDVGKRQAAPMMSYEDPNTDEFFRTLRELRASSQILLKASNEIIRASEAIIRETELRQASRQVSSSGFRGYNPVAK